MATFEESGVIRYKNSSGDMIMFYPNTLADNVSDLPDVVSSTANSVIDSKLTDINAHLANKTNPHEVTAAQVGALSSTPVPMASTDGAAYTCTVDGITELTASASFIGIPTIVSTSTSVTLNVNGLGAKQLRRGVSTSSGTTTAGYNESWLAAGKPLRIMYDGLFWIVDNARPYAADLMGTVPIANGGTGASDGAIGLANLLAAGSTVLSSNQYGDALPDAGTAGRVFFKKSDGSDMEAINAHITDENNPHKVTAAQVGADVSGSAATVQNNLDNHSSDTTKHITSTERTAWNAKQDKSTAITTSNIGSQTVNKAEYATDDVTVGTAALRNQYFVSAETTPTVNGQIAWVYG